MPPLAEARGHPARHGGDEAGPLFANAGCLEELPVPAPAHQLHPGLLVPLHARIKQGARLAFAGGGTAVLYDDVERVVRAQAAHVDLLAQRLEIGLDGAGRGPRRTGGAVKAGSDHAADTQWRFIDADRCSRQRQRTTVAVSAHLQREIEACPKGERLQRAGSFFRRASTQSDVDLCS